MSGRAGAAVRADVVVVGAGIMGAAIARAFVRRGARVSVVDQAASVASGTTGASGGMVRGYDPDPAVAALASASLAEYGATDGRSGLRRVGALTIGRASEAEALDAAAARLGGGAYVERGTSALGVQLAGGAALVEPAGGWVDPVFAAQAWLTEAGRLGTVVELRRRVTQIVVARGGLRVGLTGGPSLKAHAAVLATGAWGVRPPSGVGLPADFRTRSIQATVVERDPGTDHASYVDLRTGTYGKPVDATRTLVGLPHEVWDGWPDTTYDPSPTHAARTLEAARGHLPWLSGSRVVRVVRALEGFSRSEPLVRETRVPGVWQVRGWNGGGVRVAPAASAAIAGIVLEEMG